jgi:hypothetical protein
MGHEADDTDDTTGEHRPADNDGLTLRWLRRQFGWMKQFDNIRIPIDDDYHLELDWYDDMATGPSYHMRGGDGSFVAVLVSTVGQVRGLMKLYGVEEK